MFKHKSIQKNTYMTMESICADAEEQAEGAEFFILTL